MADPKGFLKINRIQSGYRPVDERCLDYNEVEQTLPDEARKQQASRCMDCGVPFCHWACPVSNIMPEWQDMLYQGQWEKAVNQLHQTNNFPEFTGRVCPALCEPSCVLALENAPVTIRENELAVIEKAFKEGYIHPRIPRSRTGKKVAVIGSGPAGLACADQLNQAGHHVTVFEQESAVGGLLRFGIPDFKLNKKTIDRRVDLLKKEGIVFKLNVCVGEKLSIIDLKKTFDAVCLAIGAKQPRDLVIPGRELSGIYFAMDYLTGQNKILSKKAPTKAQRMNAKGKKVLVIGGGDTGSDCVGTAHRQGACSVTQIEILSKPPTERSESMPWPLWPTLLKTSSSHEEGCIRHWSLASKKFQGDNGQVTGVEVVSVEWTPDGSGKYTMNEIKHSEQTLPADLVFLSMGFVAPVHEGLLDSLGVQYDLRGNVLLDDQRMTTVPGVFAAGDVERGASLVVWAIQSGRLAAQSISNYLSSSL